MVIILVDVIVLIVDNIIGNFGLGYEIIGIVDFNIIIEVCDLFGVVIGIGIFDVNGDFIVMLLMGMINFGDMLIVIGKDNVGNES